MKNVKLWAFLALALVACGASEGQDDTGQSADEISFRTGPIDHAAIAESGTMMQASNPFSFALDSYNTEDPFGIRPDAYIENLTTRLANFDSYDGHTDWTPEQAKAWNTRMANGNYLLVDTSKPCDWENPHTYLEIERAQLTGKDHQTCGGRMPNEDVMDVTANFLIRGPGASVSDDGALVDGVTQATQKSDDTFPYLAEMNGVL